jgi:hypothetical protein
MVCVFLSLTCTRVFVYMWRLSSSSTILFGSGCERFNSVSDKRTFVNWFDCIVLVGIDRFVV